MSTGKQESPAHDPGHGPGLKLVTCIVQRGRADQVAKAALAAGAAGVTIFFGRGLGLRERLGLLGLAIVPEKEVLLIVCPEADAQRIFQEVVQASKVRTPGMGIAWLSPIDEVVGLFKGEGEGSPQAPEEAG